MKPHDLHDNADDMREPQLEDAPGGLRITRAKVENLRSSSKGGCEVPRNTVADWLVDAAKSSAVAIVVTATPAFAFQTDLHYGLTFWLAKSAGLSSHDSHMVAIGNENSDSGMLDAKPAIIWQLCIKGDENASRLTRDLHFRSQEPVPAPRAARPVASAAAFASAGVTAVVAEPGAKYHDQLFRFGQALHAWQDTFSHVGVPASVFRCREDWMWSHPKERNGPASSDADITHLHQDECKQAAESSYEKLVELLARIRKDLLPPAWTSLQNRAARFCAMATKSDKVRWFNANGVPQGPSIVARTSIEDGQVLYSLAPPLNLLPVTPPAEIGAATLPIYMVPNRPLTPDVEVQAAIRNVVSRLDISAAPSDVRYLERFFQTMLTAPPRSLLAELAPFFGSSAPLPVESDIAQAVLRLRMVDRGVARRPGVVTIAQVSQPNVLVTVAPEQWRDLLVPARNREQPLLVGGTDGQVLGLAVLRHAPYEVVRVFTSGGERPVVKDFDVNAIH